MYDYQHMDEHIEYFVGLLALFATDEPSKQSLIWQPIFAETDK